MSVLDRFRLDGKTAIVTGGNRGIGRGISDAFAEAGANVVIANRKQEAGEQAAAAIREATDTEARHVQTDVTDDASVEELIEVTIDTFGDIDVLVNNAGTAIHTAAEETPLAEWQAILDVNLTGAFRCSKYAGQQMIETDGGSIINISSMSAFIANYPQEQVSYQASKGGLEGFKTQLASEWAEFDIRVNNINPGYIATELIEETIRENPELGDIWRAEMLQDDFGSPSDIGPLAVYLAADASSYVTGESIVIDGGYTVR